MTRITKMKKKNKKKKSLSLWSKIPHKTAQSLMLIAAILICDQLTKIIVLYTLTPKHVVKITSFFNFVLVFNTGVSFGMFQSQGMLGFWLLVSIALALCGWIIKLLVESRDHIECIGYNLIIGGAIGNLMDRFLYRGVVDFLQFHYKTYYWPAFNIADSAIVIGVAIVFGRQTWHSLKKH